MTTDFTLTMFSFDGGAPWVVAKTDDEAIAIARKAFAERYGDTAFQTPRVCRPMDRAEMFTMTYEGIECIPDGLSRDEFECECDSAGGASEDDPDCCCDVNVTLPVAQWCEILGRGSVTREFQC